LDVQSRDGGTNFILRIKEEEKRLTLHQHDDDDDEKHNRIFSPIQIGGCLKIMDKWQWR